MTERELGCLAEVEGKMSYGSHVSVLSPFQRGHRISIRAGLRKKYWIPSTVSEAPNGHGAPAAQWKVEDTAEDEDESAVM